MPLTLEQLLTRPGGFALDTASPVQRAICRIADGLPLGDLATDPEVVEIVGGPEALTRLPQKAPTEIYIVAAIRCGKSLLSAAAALRTALTINLDYLKPSEIARVSVVSVDKDKAGAVMEHLKGALEREDGLLNHYLVKSPKPTTDRLYVRRDDGRIVLIIVAAGSVGGESLVSRWTVAAIFDEAARMVGAGEGAVNFDDMRKSVIARIRRVGGQLVVVTSPWAAHGPIFDKVEAYWGKPSEQLVIVRATGPQMNPGLWTPEACEAERTAPDGAYETDVLGLFADREGGFLTAGEVRAATRDTPTELPFDRKCTYTAAMDPATAGNAWTLVIVARREGEQETDTRYSVALARQWQGTPMEPLKARAVFADMAPDLKKYEIGEVFTDRWGGSLLAEHGDYAGITVTMSKDTPEDIARRHADFRTLLRDGKIELAPVPALSADLRSKRKHLMPNGTVKYSAPTTKDGRHADYADATILAVKRATDAPSWVGAMKRWRQGGGLV